MKTYIKPVASIYDIHINQIIALSITPGKAEDEGEALGKERNGIWDNQEYNSGGLWN